MGYVALIIIPVFVAVAAVLSPDAREDTVTSARNSLHRMAASIERLREDPDILARINRIQRRLAAYLLRQAADSVEK